MLHNAANLVKGVDVDAERMLCTAEGLARFSLTRVEFINRLAVAAKLSAEAKGSDTASGALVPLVPALAPSAGPPRRRATNSKKKKKAASMNVDETCDDLEPRPAVELAPAGDAASSGAALQLSREAPPFVTLLQWAQPGRERSPRRAAGPAATSSSSSPTSPPAASAAAAFAIGQTVRLAGLNRAEFNGARSDVLLFDAEAERFAVLVDSTEQKVRVKARNMAPVVFGPLPPA